MAENKELLLSQCSEYLSYIMANLDKIDVIQANTIVQANVQSISIPDLTRLRQELLDIRRTMGLLRIAQVQINRLIGATQNG